MRSPIVAGLAAVVLVGSSLYLVDRVIAPFVALERLMIR